MQQQNYSLSALAKRDAKEDPFGKSETTAQTDNSLKALYKGVFKDDVKYEKGQFITKGGSLWHVENDHVGEFDHKNFKLCAKEWTE